MSITVSDPLPTVTGTPSFGRSSSGGGLLTDALSSAQNSLASRIGGLQQTIIHRAPNGGSAFSLDNAQNEDSWDGRYLTDDLAQQQQLNLLSKTLSDPSWTASLDNSVNAQHQAADAAATDQWQQTGANTTVSDFGAGRAGSSVAAVHQANNDATLAAAKSQAAQHAQELHDSGVAQLNQVGQTLLNQILSGNQGTATAQGYSNDAQQTGIQGSAMQAQNYDYQRNLLSQALGGFITNGVSPFVQGGFQYGTNQDQQHVRDGTYVPGQPTGWWGQ